MRSRTCWAALTASAAILRPGPVQGWSAPMGAQPRGRRQCRSPDGSDGTWGTAGEVPGTATLNTGGNAAIDSLSCASTGNCSAGGTYTDLADGLQAFVVSHS